MDTPRAAPQGTQKGGVAAMNDVHPCAASQWNGDPHRCRMCNWRLKRNKEWCSRLCRREWLQQHSWNAAKTEARKRAQSTCQLCRARGRVDVHHLHPVVGQRAGLSCLHHQNNLQCLCSACHRDVHQEAA